MFLKNKKKYLKLKLEERDLRHKKLGDSRYLVEPNIKDGKGGLRDLQTLLWLGKYIYQVKNMSGLVESNILTNEEITTHWNSIKDLEKKEKLNVVRNVRYTDNGKILTSAGVSSGIDLCLYFLCKKYGKKLYDEVKRYIEWESPHGITFSNEKIPG